MQASQDMHSNIMINTPTTTEIFKSSEQAGFSVRVLSQGLLLARSTFGLPDVRLFWKVSPCDNSNHGLRL